jgi:antitoxin ParD1/3/4
MNVNLTPQLEEMVRRNVESGAYSNASEVVREALRLLDRHDRSQRLQAALDVGLREIERGETHVWTKNSMAELIREADEEDRLGLSIRDDDVLPMDMEREVSR